MRSPSPLPIRPTPNLQKALLQIAFGIRKADYNIAFGSIVYPRISNARVKSFIQMIICRLSWQIILIIALNALSPFFRNWDIIFISVLESTRLNALDNTETRLGNGNWSVHLHLILFHPERTLVLCMRCGPEGIIMPKRGRRHVKLGDNKNQIPFTLRVPHLMLFGAPTRFRIYSSHHGHCDDN